MNASELTDVELNRAMIWLYPPAFKLDDYGTFVQPAYSTGIVCYLTDWNLTMPLAVENKLDMDCDAELWRIYGPSASYSKHKSLLRAICESLVMIKMEGK